MKPFKILAIDGGGIKGFYSARILSHFEEALQRLGNDGARIVDHVDLICGTSTGGLIALALALRIPADVIAGFYESEGPSIFRGSQGPFALLRQTLCGGKFSDRRLREALNRMFGGARVGDCDSLLCIPTYDFTHGTYEIFKFDHREGGLSRHNGLPIVDVALATCAAPTYFPLAQLEGENDTQFVDGGVWANNPALVGLTEAMWHFVGRGKSYDCVDLVSIASLNLGSGKPPMLKRRRSFLRWAPDLFDLSLIAQSEFTDVFLRMIQEQGVLPITYRRIGGGANISRDQSHLIKLDLATPESLTLMKQLATKAYYDCRADPTIQAFFDGPKSYRVR